jgi:hypothetical protein
MYRLIIAAFFIDLYFGHEDGGDIFLQNIGELEKLSTYLYMALPSFCWTSATFSVS